MSGKDLIGSKLLGLWQRDGYWTHQADVAGRRLPSLGWNNWFQFYSGRRGISAGHGRLKGDDKARILRMRWDDFLPAQEMGIAGTTLSGDAIKRTIRHEFLFA
jgi:hypothetical protein